MKRPYQQDQERDRELPLSGLPRCFMPRVRLPVLSIALQACDDGSSSLSSCLEHAWFGSRSPKTAVLRGFQVLADQHASQPPPGEFEGR